MHRPTVCARALLVMLICAAANPARAESAFELTYPIAFGHIPASTYDARGDRIGEADVAIETLTDGRVRMTARSGSRDGARTTAIAWFAPVEPGRSLRLVRQESLSRDPQNHSLGHLVIDHVAQVASCTTPERPGTQRVALPAEDRVVNVPMNLFFLPLVRGERRSLKFQLFLCRDGARTIDFEAWVAPNGHRREGPVEIRYAPDFGSVISMLARNFVPRLSFFFDPAEPHGWLGHRIPLYSGGPEVTVVREGVPAGWLVDD